MALLDRGQPTFSIGHAAHLVEVLRDWHISADELLAGSPLSRTAIYEPSATIGVPTLVSMLERARQLTGHPALGAHIGLRTRATLYGHVGFAVLSARNIREAIEVALAYGRLVTTGLSVRFRIEKGQASLTLDEHTDFGSARDIVVMTSLVALWQVSRSLTGREFTTSTFELALPEPEYRIEQVVPGLRFRFNRPEHRLTFDARSLELPYLMPDPVSLRIARDQCERRLETLGFDAGVSARVRGLLAGTQRGLRSLEEVADALNRSPRTLKRQLAAQGLRFSALRDEERCERAMMLLRHQEASLAEVADQLGYSNASAFERAFLRWTGRTPAEWRRAQAARASLVDN
jgi:AraC-like DNA-binding protein